MIYALTKNEWALLSADFTLDAIDEKYQVVGRLPTFEAWFFRKFSKQEAHLSIAVRYDEEHEVKAMYLTGDTADVVAFKLKHLCD